MLTALAIALGTLASEDLTCIATGLLIQRGQIGATAGILACTIGIFVGDVGLWTIGRLFGTAALAWPWTARQLQHHTLRDVRGWLDRHAAGAIVGSRFLPGTRFALYVMSGVLRVPLAEFSLWALIAALLWTPTIVLLTATLGDAFVGRVRPLLGAGWLARLAVVAVALSLLQGVRALATKPRRTRLAARIARSLRWEFWPMWLFYAPVGMWVLYLASRYRGLSTITAANPGIRDGGTVGESKFDILSKLPADCIVPSVLIGPGVLSKRVALVQDHLESACWSFPVVLKPDVGQRGAGVKLARSMADVTTYLSKVADGVVVQPYHPGPFEAGVFYYRRPGSATGRILSITDKHFPVIVGDGLSTVEELIWAHPRYRLQADTFLARQAGALERVLDSSETLPLGMAGNHCQGTLFLDGHHLITPALENRIDAIARAFNGFFVGRFDIRYGDVERFKAGTDLAIVELNGATAESTNIYDPQTTLFDAYRLLFRQWSIVFSIGAANHAAGAPVTSHRRLFELLRAHLRATEPFPVSD
jgi:membrane protein DedA with SNARE-associated domain